MPYIVSREEDHKKTAPLMGALHHHIQMEAGPDAPLKNPETEGTYEIHPVDITQDPLAPGKNLPGMMEGSPNKD